MKKRGFSNTEGSPQVELNKPVFFAVKISIETKKMAKEVFRKCFIAFI